MKNKSLVIGGSGFIGRNLCEYLLKKGDLVTSFDLEPPKDKVAGVNYINGSFFDDEKLKEIVDNQDVIFHSISTINPANSVTDYMRGYEKDFIQTIKLFEFLKRTKTKVVFLSSGGTVYGDVEIMPITEGMECKPKNHYGNIKLCIENYIRTINKIENSHHIIARISNPYGPGQDSNKGVGFIDAVIRNGISKNRVEIWGDGMVIRDYIYISDVCKMLYTLSVYEGREDVFNISSNCGETQIEIIEIAKKYFKDLNVQYTPSRDIDAKRIVLCNKKILKIMDSELVNIDDGIGLYIDYLKGQEND